MAETARLLTPKQIRALRCVVCMCVLVEMRGRTLLEAVLGGRPVEAVSRLRKRWQMSKRGSGHFGRPDCGRPRKRSVSHVLRHTAETASVCLRDALPADRYFHCASEQATAGGRGQATAQEARSRATPVGPRYRVTVRAAAVIPRHGPRSRRDSSSRPAQPP